MKIFATYLHTLLRRSKTCLSDKLFKMAATLAAFWHWNFWRKRTISLVRTRRLWQIRRASCRINSRKYCLAVKFPPSKYFVTFWACTETPTVYSDGCFRLFSLGIRQSHTIFCRTQAAIWLIECSANHSQHHLRFCCYSSPCIFVWLQPRQMCYHATLSEHGLTWNFWQSQVLSLSFVSCKNPLSEIIHTVTTCSSELYSCITYRLVFCKDLENFSLF